MKLYVAIIFFVCCFELSQQATRKEALQAFKTGAVSNFNTGPVKCYNGWIELADYDACYIAMFENATWENARDTCRDSGGYLATFDSYKELYDVSYYVIRKNVTGFFHVGYLQTDKFANSTFFTETLTNITNLLNVTKLSSGQNQTCGAVNSPGENGNVSLPLLRNCSLNASDNKTKNYFVCKKPDDRCHCTKVNEPVVRNFDGRYFEVEDQTEYILFQDEKNVITALMWQDKKPTINSSSGYKPDTIIPTSLLRLVISNKTEYSMTNQNGTVIFYINATLKGNLSTTVSYTDTLVTVKNNTRYSLILQTTDNNINLFYDGTNFILSMPTAATKSTGICGKCSKNINLEKLLFLDKYTVFSKHTVAQASISPRVKWSSVTPAVTSCTSQTLKKFAATTCRPLFDLTLFFGPCLAANKTLRTELEKKTFRQCMQRVCEGGPLVACPFFERLSKQCKFNDSFREVFHCNKTKPCPSNYTYNSNGYCYQIAKLPTTIKSTDGKLSWHHASELCYQRGAYLASILTFSDHSFIRYYVRSKLNDTQDLWIGAVADPNRQQSFWLDGSAMNFQAWDTDARNWSLFPNRRCGVYTVNNTWTLADCIRNDSTEIINPVAALCSIRSYSEFWCSGMPCVLPKECIKNACTMSSIKVSYCAPNPCLNGGECKSKNFSGAGFLCVCPPNLYGARCERARDTPDISMTVRPCPSPEWLQVQDGNCYMIIAEKVAWEVAREKCRDSGGHLITFDSKDEIVTQKVAEVAEDLASGFYHIGYIVQGLKRFRESIPLDYVDTFLTGSVIPGCAVAQPSSGTFYFTACSNLVSADYGFICERETNVCKCGKWNEPVVRTFNGEDIPVVNNTEYLLFMAPGKFSVSILVREDNVGFVNRATYEPDLIPKVQTVVIQFYEDHSVCTLTTDTNGKSVANCESSKVILKTVGDDVLLSHMNGSVQVLFDGKNVELSVDYRIAQRAKPGAGLCGMCDDRVRDDLYSPSQMKIEDKRQAAESWVVGRDIWPSTRPKVASCVTSTFYDAAIRRCSPLVDVANDLTKSCLRNDSISQQYIYELYDGCLSHVCQFGFGAACEFFELFFKACKNETTSAEFESLKCNASDLCQPSKASPNGYCYSFDYAVRSHFDSRTFCHNKGNNLAMIDTLDEHNYLIANVPVNWYWAGAYVEPDNTLIWWDDGREMKTNVWNIEGVLHNNLTCSSYLIDNSGLRNWWGCFSNGVPLCSTKAGTSCGSSVCYPGQKCSTSDPNDSTAHCLSSIIARRDQPIACSQLPCKNSGSCPSDANAVCKCPTNLLGDSCELIDPSIATNVTLPPEVADIPLGDGSNTDTSSDQNIII